MSSIFIIIELGWIKSILREFNIVALRNRISLTVKLYHRHTMQLTFLECQYDGFP